MKLRRLNKTFFFVSLIAGRFTKTLELDIYKRAEVH